MRTTNIENIRDDFASALADLRASFSSIEAAGVPGKVLKQSAETVFLSLAVLLEGYLSDLLVAYINKDSQAFITLLESKYSVSTEDPIAARAKFLMAATSQRRHLTVTDIRRVLNADGDNLPDVNASASLKAFAGKFLAKKYAARITGITRRQAAHLDTARAIRNFLAHRSSSALKRMGEALASNDLPAGLRRTVYTANNVGVYLAAWWDGDRRIATWINAIEDLGKQVSH
jgi:hypothetical protein